ncbi:hypothetical protein [Cellulophaga tyrosinoxydans]|uniref:Uncharacterized protein n=1 Tax=Cellulophaga tyrosinoxydans TaxID=504486 RepID=A0A1W2AUB9_9FLAO|nr:hypothetical protein [Cellulophaga tyrosinoxydans]SMC64319.1 hypothetical protein SAMN05660703_2235 [Cellulophaga tyrosinoxydans]
MKNIFKKLLFSLLSLTVLNSCTEEEELIGFPLEIQTEATEIVGTVSSNPTSFFEGLPLNITVTLPQTFASDADVEVTALFNSGAQTVATVTVPAGATTATGKITLPSSDGFNSGIFEGLLNYCQLSLTAILLDELEPGKAYTITSNNFGVNILDQYSAYTTAVANSRMNYLLDWANPEDNDLDVYIAGLESSETGTRYESDIFNAEYPDGEYTIEVGLYIVSETSIPWKLFFVHPDQVTVDVFEGTFDNLTIGTGLNDNIDIVTFTKTTDPDTGDVTFVAGLSN